MESPIFALPTLFPARNKRHGLSLCANHHILCRSTRKSHSSDRKSFASMRIHCQKREESSMDIDRRRLLLSSSALGMTALTAQKAMAKPFPPPDLSKCAYPTDLPTCVTLEGTCCPPYLAGIHAVDFRIPRKLPLRTRPAAHLVDKSYIEKYEAAVRKMKELDDSDPRSFTQRAKVHCAYCEGAYLAGPENKKVSIHGSWFFAPFHRWYLYFHERILGSLIDDDSFALPFWNWDAEAGMEIPAIFTDPCSSLYDDKRNACHLPHVILNLREPTSCQSGSIKENYCSIYTHMVSAARTTRCFHGAKQRYEDDEPECGAGTLESSPHNRVHTWTGSFLTPFREDMGRFYSGARDPIFYSHHANVDRMWSIWNDKLEGKNYMHPDLLDTKFLFYDENKQLVQVKAGDCYDHLSLGYRYEKLRLPWLERGNSIKKAGKLMSPQPYQTRSSMDIIEGADDKIKPLLASQTFSVKMPNTTIPVMMEMEEKEAVLSIDGIQVDDTASFNIFIGFPEADANTPFDSPHYAGSYVNVGHGMHKKCSFKVGLSETLKDLKYLGYNFRGSEDERAIEEESLLVRLVPDSPKFSLTTLKIELVPKNN